ncbi:MAG: putative DNA binding domain-containing protein [Erysipelotrichaceae bacterium]|nr:putative DNA binding domain-containing protein [Erysipelotrichaceae bacterium]
MYQESASVELKRELTDAIKNEIVAFLNTNDGIIYVGIDDDGKPYKPFLLMNKDEIDIKVSNWLQNSIRPLPSNLIDYHFNKEGILVIKIKEGKNKPYYLKDKGPKPSGVYKRVGSTIRKANNDEILRMIMSSKNYIYEDDISVQQNLTFKYLSSTFEENNLLFNDRSMISLGIRKTNGSFTNLGYILSDQSKITVKIAEYDKNMNFKVKKQLTGSLIKLFNETKEQADRLNDVSAIIDTKSYKRIETVSYPDTALREMILNAFCHADLFLRSNIKIEFFEDKCKISSPGGIFNATLDEIMSGLQTYRNPKLVHIFDMLGLIENYGTGIPKTILAYQNEQVKPNFKASDNFFVVTLPNINYLNHNRDYEIKDDLISELELSILRIIDSNPGIKLSAIHELIIQENSEITIYMVRNSIKRKLQKYIEFKGSRRFGGYYMKNKI